jgi:hypothetical protein
MQTKKISSKKFLLGEIFEDGLYAMYKHLYFEAIEVIKDLEVRLTKFDKLL